MHTPIHRERPCVLPCPEALGFPVELKGPARSACSCVSSRPSGTVDVSMDTFLALSHLLPVAGLLAALSLAWAGCADARAGFLASRLVMLGVPPDF